MCTKKMIADVRFFNRCRISLSLPFLFEPIEGGLGSDRPGPVTYSLPYKMESNHDRTEVLLHYFSVIVRPRRMRNNAGK